MLIIITIMIISMIHGTSGGAILAIPCIRFIRLIILIIRHMIPITVVGIMDIGAVVMVDMRRQSFTKRHARLTTVIRPHRCVVLHVARAAARAMMTVLPADRFTGLLEEVEARAITVATGHDHLVGARIRVLHAFYTRMIMAHI